MIRSWRFTLTMIILSFVLLACNTDSNAGNTPAPTLPLPDLATPTTPLPPTATQPVPYIVAQLNLNIRSGPGTNYDIVGALPGAAQANVIGRSEDNDWWLLDCPYSLPAPCWVSADPDLALAYNIAGIEAATAPPTPTPETGPPPMLVYVQNGNLIAQPLNLSGNVVTLSGGNIPLISDNVTNAQIMDNGNQVIYLQDLAGNHNQLNVVPIRGGSPTVLVVSSDLPTIPDPPAPDMQRRIDWFSLLPANQGALFNTDLSPFPYPGVNDNQDLWRVTLDGSRSEIYPAGTGLFATVSNGGRLLISNGGTANDTTRTQGYVLRSNLDGTDRNELAQFDFILTYSEYTYMPAPQWSTDGTRAFVAIPSSDPLDEDAQVTLWQIPVTGPAQQLNTIAGNFLHHNVTWSPTGRRLVYTQFAGTSGDTQLFLADGNGNNRVQYGTQDNILRFLAWNPNETQFLYATTGQYHIGQGGSPPINRPLPAGHVAVSAQWVSENAFVIVSRNRATQEWTFTSGNLAGATVPLLTVTSDELPYDLWVWSP